MCSDMVKYTDGYCLFLQVNEYGNIFVLKQGIRVKNSKTPNFLLPSKNKLRLKKLMNHSHLEENVKITNRYEEI